MAIDTVIPPFHQRKMTAGLNIVRTRNLRVEAFSLRELQTRRLPIRSGRFLNMRALLAWPVYDLPHDAHSANDVELKISSSLCAITFV